jgi:cell division protein FtsI/penicillin-binding protein 2
VTPETKANIEAQALNGIGFEFEEMRDYPEASAAAHLLGFVGKDSEGSDQGYFGLEGFYDLALKGKPGFLTREKDAKGLPILLGDSREISAIGGVNLVTHIDKTIQLTLDKKLLSGIEKYGATGGIAIVMRPADGAILGMSSYPSYDPGTYFKFGDEFFKNPAVSGAFEPGSIFKILIMSAALDEGEVTPDTKCEVCSGPLRVGKYYIETWNQVYHPDSTMLDVIVNSDNVGMAWVAQKLGKDMLYEYLSAFGVGSLTGIDLQGEATPKLRDKNDWSIVDVTTAGFGQGVAITPIQMVRVVAAIANRGVLVAPQVVDRLVGDGWQEEINPEIGERVISKKAASQMRAMMVEAAKNGEAKWTHLRGFKVAGKTGTAQIPIAGHYDEEKTIASFIGFVPADDPRFVMLVTLREPTSSPWASETAAPLWYSIAKDLFLYFGIQPEN